MIGAIANAMSNTTFANITQNTSAQVAIETTLKAIGRPGFILIDKNIKDDTKKYAATKEFLYQFICLLVYLMVIPPIFKSGSFRLGKKLFGKSHPEFSKFESIKEYLDYHKYASKGKAERCALLLRPSAKEKFRHDGLREKLWREEKPEKYDLIKGTVEMGTFIGSILGLTIFAPQVSHYTIHPIMNWLGLRENKNDKSEKLNVKA